MEWSNGVSGSLEGYYLKRSIIRGKTLQGSLFYFTPFLRSSMLSEIEVSLCTCFCPKEYSNARIFLEFSVERESGR